MNYSLILYPCSVVWKSALGGTRTHCLQNRYLFAAQHIDMFHLYTLQVLALSLILSGYLMAALAAQLCSKILTMHPPTGWVNSLYIYPPTLLCIPNGMSKSTLYILQPHGVSPSGVSNSSLYIPQPHRVSPSGVNKSSLYIHHPHCVSLNRVSKSFRYIFTNLTVSPLTGWVNPFFTYSPTSLCLP